MLIDFSRCIMCRDILELLQQAGLEIESLSRWHFGTTYLVIAKPGVQHVDGRSVTDAQ
jgi:hypothetical protein